MILEFKVENFGSIRDEVKLSFVASKNHRPDLIPTGRKSYPFVVPSAVIYGANASGKSTFIKAFQTFKHIVRTSAYESNAEKGLPVTPFLLSNTSGGQPSGFEISVLLNGIRYQYGFEATSKSIQSEWLIVFESERAQTWFERTAMPNEKGDEFDISKTYIKGPRDLWKSSTRKNALFLSTAVMLNSEVLTPIYEAIVSDVVSLDPTILSPDFTSRGLEDPKQKQRILNFMNAADFGIGDIIKESRTKKALGFEFSEEDGREKPVISTVERAYPRFIHSVDGLSMDLSFELESTGTQRFFSLIGPLLEILDKGRLLVVDELENNIHPLLLKEIIDLFSKPEVNKNQAQLLITAHNTILLRGKTLHRDQIWFTEKGADLSTKLFSLHEFVARNNEAVEKSYLEGQYGGVPIFYSSLFENEQANEEK